MTAKPKSKLMAALREQRARLGLVRVELWIRREHIAKVRKYVARLGAEEKQPHNSGEGR